MISKIFKLTGVFLLVGIALFALSGQNSALAFQAATSTHTPTSAVSPAAPVQQTATLTPTAASATSTPKPTATTPAQAATVTPTVKSNATVTPTVKPTATVKPTVKPSATVTPTVVTAATVTPTVKATATATPTKAPTAIPTKVPARALSPNAGTVSSISTSIVVQNTDANTSANISASFYDLAGSISGPIAASVAPNRSTTIDQRTAGGLPGSPSTYQGSVVLSSNTQIAAVVLELSGNAASLSTNFRADAYSGFSSASAATNILMPQLLKNVNDPATNSTYNSTFVVQNTSISASTNVTLNYKQSTGATYSRSTSIPAGTSLYVDLGSEPALSAVPMFYGSASVVADQPVVVVVNANAAGLLSVYQGFTPSDAGTTLYMPQLLSNVFDPGTGFTWGTGVLVMAANGGTAHVTLTGTNSSGGTFVQNQTANPQATFDQRNLSGFFYGTAVLTSDTPVIATVSYVVNYNASRGLAGATYRAFTAAGGGSTVFVPLLQKNSFDSGTGVSWGTGLLGQLLGSTATTITVTYYDSVGNTYVRTAHVTPSSPMFTVDQRSDAGLPNGNMSAVLTSSPAQPFGVIVSSVGPSSVLGDANMSYAGTPH